MPVDGPGLATYHRGLGVLAIVLGSIVIVGTPRWAKPLQIGALVAVHCAIGVWMIDRSPEPAIDVHVFQRYAISALRSGANPYAITFPDIYRFQNGDYYGPGLSVGGRLQFGYPYLPLSLLVAMPGQLFGGDSRYAQLVAIELAAIFMAFARPRGFGIVAAALYLTTPRLFFVLEQSWTEPFLVLGVTAVLFAACRPEQTASDAQFGGRPNGAFTYLFLKALADNPTSTRSDLHKAVTAGLRSEDFQQRSTLEGPLKAKKAAFGQLW